MSTSVARASRDWLALREPADARARSVELVAQLRSRLPSEGPLRIHDLGSGTGAMRRWLAPQLPGPQHWIEHDRDAELLNRDEEPALTAADGRGVSVVVRPSELASLSELDGASLVTATALLDVLTFEALTALVDLVARAGVPCLLTLSVVGRVHIRPEEPLDGHVMRAFNDHQRRVTSIGQLLGPGAAHAAVLRLAAAGMDVRTATSRWTLDANQPELLVTWLDEWVEAACVQDPSLARAACDYLQLRHGQAREGSLTATVEHLDVLAWPL